MQSLLKNNQQILPLSGCTEFLQGQAELAISLPRYLVALLNIKEFTRSGKNRTILGSWHNADFEKIIGLGEKIFLRFCIRAFEPLHQKTCGILQGSVAIWQLPKGSKLCIRVMMILDSRVEIKLVPKLFGYRIQNMQATSIPNYEVSHT